MDIMERHKEIIRKVISYAKSVDGVTPSDIASLLDVSIERGRQILEKMERRGLLKKVKNGVRIPTEKLLKEDQYE